VERGLELALLLTGEGEGMRAGVYLWLILLLDI